MHNLPTTLRFDVTEDESPIVLAMNLKRHSVTDNISVPSRIIIDRPHDRNPRILQMYTSGDTLFNIRLILFVAPVTKLSACMLGKALNFQPLGGIPLAKRIHNATHESEPQTLSICEDAGLLDEKLKNRNP